MCRERARSARGRRWAKSALLYAGEAWCVLLLVSGWNRRAGLAALCGRLAAGRQGAPRSVCWCTAALQLGSTNADQSTISSSCRGRGAALLLESQGRTLVRSPPTVRPLLPRSTCIARERHLWDLGPFRRLFCSYVTLLASFIFVFWFVLCSIFLT